MDLKQHPLSAAFPSMPDHEFDTLVDDIKKHGLREPVITFDGMVLDGWHRYRACDQAKKKCATQPFEDGDPVAFVLSRNLHRRHLSPSQKAQAIVSCGNWRQSGITTSAAQKSSRGEAASPLPLTNEQMAAAAEVSPRTIQKAKEAERAGLGHLVREGKASVEKVAEVAKLPPRKREKAVAAIERGEKPAAKKPKPAEDLQGLVDELTEQRNDLADTARELEDRLTAFEKTEPDEQQKEILRLQKRVVQLEAEVSRLTRARDDCQAKCNELIREVKKLRRG